MSTSRSRKPKSSRPRKAKPVVNLADTLARISRNKPTQLSTLSAILQEVQSAIGADALTIYQFDSHHQQLNELVSVGKRVELAGFLAIGQGQGLTGWAALQKKPLLLKNRSANLAFDPDRDFASMLATPLPIGSAPLGVLVVGTKAAGGLDSASAELIESITDAISASLERYLFCKRLETATREIERLNRYMTESSGEIAAGRELGTVAGKMVALNHEINEALAVIIGHVQCLVASRAASTQKELSRFRRMEEAALRIRTVNQTILKLARQGQGRATTTVTRSKA
ncbi:MAG: GAF domain-containing protein [bacterium]|nr:GAF domain-containing protein [bacterium]